jgi:hypothetical protein
MEKILLVLFLSFSILLPLAIVAKNQPLLTVEVLKTETCITNSDTTSCSSTSFTTPGQTATSSVTPLGDMQVNILVKMPDGNAVEMQCHSPVRIYLSHRQVEIPAVCFEPRLGTYQAAINAHNVHLMIPVTGKPKYNKDGALMQPAKTKLEDVKFSFR